MMRYAIALVAVMSFLAPLATAQDKKPNVLFIAVDDLNVWCSCLEGHPQAKTPNIDRLAKRGMLFTHAYCAAPACNPSRAALLSGRRPTTTGIYHNNQPWQPVLKDVTTLPSHFKDNGYEVLGGGKIFHGGPGEAKFYEETYNRPGDPVKQGQSFNGLKMAQFDWGPIDATDEQMGDYKLVTWASEQLAKKHAKPFFLAVGFAKPHLPWYVPKKYFDMFPLDGIKLPPVTDGDLKDIPAAGIKMARPEGDHKAVIDAKLWPKAVQAYLATIAFLDGQVGRLLDAFDKSPGKDNTIVVFWGDHGWHLGEKQHWRKFALWEEATHSPLIIAAPGVTKAGSKCQAPVDFMNILPSLEDLCGLPHLKQQDGVSMLPLLKDPQAKWERPALTTHGRGNHAVRTAKWRYIRYADGSEELYDHEADPREWKNLAGEAKHADVKKQLAKWLPEKEAANAPTVKEP